MLLSTTEPEHHAIPISERRGQLSAAAAALANLMGGSEYVKLLLELGEALNHKGFVTAIDDLKFSLERELLNLELLRIQRKGALPGMPANLHEAADFVLGVGQAIPHLSEKARRELRGKVLGGLKTNGLRPLQHELRIAGMISHFGFDVNFSDLEGNGGGFDFLARRNDRAFEIEGKCVPAYLGQAISPGDAEKFFLELRRRFSGWTEGAAIPILDVSLSKRLNVDSASVTALIKACNQAASCRNTVVIGDYAIVRFLGAAPESAKDLLVERMHADRMSTYANVHLSITRPGVLVRLSSDQGSRFAPKALATLGDAAKHQFTGSRPGIIWLHVDYLGPDSFDALAYAEKGPSIFDLLALAVLDSPKRSHLCQLIFSGGSYLERRGEYATSRFKSVVYNASNCRFGRTALFPGGRTIMHPKEGMGEGAKSLLRTAKLNFSIASGPREPSVAITEGFVERLCRSFERKGQMAAIGLLFHEALKLGEQGRYDDAVKIYNRLLLLTTGEDDPSQETTAAVYFNRGNMLSEMGRCKQALEAYEAVVSRFGESKAPELAEKVARALFNAAKLLESDAAHTEQAIGMYERICRKSTGSPDLFPKVIVAQAYVDMGTLLGAGEAAVQAFDEVIRRFEHSENPGLHEQLQKALLNKFHVLEAMNRHAGALKAVNTALTLRDPPNPDLKLWALVWKIRILAALGRECEIPDLCDEMQAGLEPMRDLWLKEACAQSLLRKASILKAAGTRTAEIGVYETIVSRLGLDVDQEIVDLVVTSQEERVAALIALEQSSETLAVCDDIVERCDGKAPPSASSEHVVWALAVKQSVLAHKEKSAEAAEICSQIIDRFGPSSATPLPVAAAKALAARAAHLHDLGQFGDALADCNSFLASYGSSDKPEVLAELAYFLLSQGSCLLNIGRKADAERVLKRLVARFGEEHAQDIACYVTAARALLIDTHGDHE